MAGNAPHHRAVQADPAWRIGIVRSVWHDDLTRSLVDEAVAALVESGVPREKILTIDAPGSFEIPLLAQDLLVRCHCDGVIACAVILTGGTHHAGLISRAATDGLMQVQLTHEKPVAHAVLAVDTLDDARIRTAPGPESRGREAAHALLAALARRAELAQEKT